MTPHFLGELRMTDAEIGAWAEAVGGSEEERVSGCVEARLVYDSARAM